MHDRGEHARQRDAEDRERFAIRHEERAMEDVERRLEHELAALGEDEERAKDAIEDEWRREHWGRDPDRPPAWRRDERPPRR